MKDSAGAHIKVNVARAVMLGTEIQSPEDFIKFCQEKLMTRSMGQECNSSARNAFTSVRGFHLIDLKTLAQYRADLPQVTAWAGMRSPGRFAFWAGKEEDQVSRKWLACTCDMCGLDNHSDCLNKHLFLVDAVDRNGVETVKLTVKKRADRTRQDEISASKKVCCKRQVILVN